MWEVPHLQNTRKSSVTWCYWGSFGLVLIVILVIWRKDKIHYEFMVYIALCNYGSILLIPIVLIWFSIIFHSFSQLNHSLIVQSWTKSFNSFYTIQCFYYEWKNIHSINKKFALKYCYRCTYTWTLLQLCNSDLIKS